jgi:hypothetical protein
LLIQRPLSVYTGVDTVDGFVRGICVIPEAALALPIAGSVS